MKKSLKKAFIFLIDGFKGTIFFVKKNLVILHRFRSLQDYGKKEFRSDTIFCVVAEFVFRGFKYRNPFLTENS